MTSTARLDIRPDELVATARRLLDEGRRLGLVAGHDDGDQLRVVYLFLGPARDARLELSVSLPADVPHLPSLADISFSGGRFERELHDLFGVEPVGHPRLQRLVHHQHWPEDWNPMRREPGPVPTLDETGEPFPFLRVDGPGVYEIPVGPIHAGLIEPGHFRFSVVGETILNLKARLWFVHKGIEKLFEGRVPDAGIELAERVSGDTAVGHTLAYCLAVEDALDHRIPIAGRYLRALLLELERLYNHVADLGALANDVGYGIIHAHCGRLRERLLRVNERVTGHRLLRRAVCLGGASVLDLPGRAELEEIAADLAEIVALTLANQTVLDRFSGTSVLSTEQARTLGCLGYVARASGLDIDARRDHPDVDLGPALRTIVHRGGDVLARYLVRRDEFAESVGLIVAILERLDDLRGQPTIAPLEGPEAPCAGVGICEAWRGTTVHRVELTADGHLSRVKIVDPSWFNWPALPRALQDTIIPDFPLTNKSFNQSYAGNDL